jgi:AraC-like DNA-binding protein
MIMAEPAAISKPTDAQMADCEPERAFHPARNSDIMLLRLLFAGPEGAFTEKVRESDEPDVLFTVCGYGQSAFGSVAGARFTVAASNQSRATFIPYGADSAVVFAANRTVSALLFPPMYLAGLVSGRRHSNIAPVLFSEDDRLTSLIDLIEGEILQPSFASDLLVDGLSRAAAALLARLDVASIGAEADRIHLAPWKLRRVLDHIEAHLDRDIALDDLSVVAELSPFHFSRVFKLATGVSPYRYVRDRRLMRSRTLLAESKMGIAELALACGFANQSHFTSAFTKASRISPARFRRQCHHTEGR